MERNTFVIVDPLGGVIFLLVGGFVEGPLTTRAQQSPRLTPFPVAELYNIDFAQVGVVGWGRGSGSSSKGRYPYSCRVGAPGKDPTAIGKGLNPEPPYLPYVAARWSSAELFWIAKNGIRMTGMPAFGSTHKDEEIWKVVAFVQRLPKVSEEEYAKMEHP
jgi:hypothetical protein